MSAITPTTTKTTKGPGTNRQQLENFFWSTDSARSDHVEALIKAGLDASTLFGSAWASGRGGLLDVPNTGAAVNLDDAVDAELTGTRFTIPSTIGNGICLLRSRLFFQATAAGVDVTDIRWTGGLFLGFSTVEGVAAGTTAVTRQTISNAFSATAHSVEFDVDGSTLCAVNLEAIFATAPSYASQDWYVVAKSVSDAGGTCTYKGGYTDVRFFTTATFIGADEDS